MTTVTQRFAEVAAAHERCFWLDGGGGRDWSGGRSLLGWLTPDDVTLTQRAGRVYRHQQGREEVVGTDIFTVLADEVAASTTDQHWAGCFGYGARQDLPGRSDPTVPDAIWMRTSQVETFHHPPAAEGRSAPVMGESAPPDPAYRSAFAAVQEHLHAGNSYEVNLTYREDVRSGLAPESAYLRLRERNPAPYAGYLQVPGLRLLSSSPERFAVIDGQGWVETKPIKGTTPRDTDPVRDAELRAELTSDPKIRAENLMIVDLLRHDLSMICEPGTVSVPRLMAVESYQSVHQLVTTVRGRLRPGIGTIAALRELFPAGSMTGAPKLRTMQIIDEVESTPRGLYSGAFGWISPDGRADLGVVIRSLIATPVEGGWRYRLGTGGGITVASQMDQEWAEAHWKADRLKSLWR